LEADEQLQLLDQDIVKLEEGEDDKELLEEIFRAAHTLKGSSGMLGHRRMAELTHAMESVLDRVRKRTLEVSTRVVDALLGSLDVLRVLKGEIVSGEVSSIDIGSTIAQLERVQEGGEEVVVEEKKGGDGGAEFSLDEGERQKVQEAVLGGRNAFRVEVRVDEGIAWGAVRCFQVVNDLSNAGEVIATVPSRVDIEELRVGRDVVVVYATEEDEEGVRKILGQIPDVALVGIGPYGAEGEELEEEEEGEEEVSGGGGKAEGEDAGKGMSHEAKTSQTVRIDVKRLDDLMNMVGELAIFHPRIHRIGKVLESTYKNDDNVRALGETSTSAMKIVNELQEDIMKIRMLPVGTVFNSFPRMVRDLARRAEKDVNFEIEGQETEIDRTVVDHLRDPLLHLLRNAVDHGIESPGERVAKGKAKKGTIRLAAWHEEGNIVIVTEDDGRGIDAERVKESAVRKGLVMGGVVEKMSEEEAIDLIFHSGMSTAREATELSGRGVGMDVVRKNIEAMNGVVIVETRVDEGTKFMLRLPLTLAMFQGLLVTSMGTIYAIPLISVTETLKLEELETRMVEEGEILRVRDSIMPLIRLRQVFWREGMEGGAEGFVVVIKDRARKVGLVVDSLMEPQEVVVKGLGRFMGDVHGIAGASILGDGTVALIMDAPSLIRRALSR